MSKIFDCITFFQENFITNLRFEILNDVVDYFVICESNYDHYGRKKKINFNLNKKNFQKKVIHLVMNEKFTTEDVWKNQAKQREYIFKGLKEANKHDLIMFSDPDEIPNPNTLKKIELNSKFGIFLQDCYCYKFNIFNKYESPWEGTRVCKFENLNSIDYMRQKILKKNINKSFLKFYIEKSIQLFENGGWHFNSLLKPEEISLKLKSFAHTEYAKDEYSNPEIIKRKISEKKDLFNRGNIYQSIKLDSSFPKYILENKERFLEWID